MKVETLVGFSGVPKGTKGNAEKDYSNPPYINWKITWDLERTKPLVDWFNDEEFKKYLKVIED